MEQLAETVPQTIAALEEELAAIDTRCCQRRPRSKRATRVLPFDMAEVTRSTATSKAKQRNKKESAKIAPAYDD